MIDYCFSTNWLTLKMDLFTYIWKKYVSTDIEKYILSHISPNLFICNYIHPFTFFLLYLKCSEFTGFHFVWNSVCVCTLIHMYMPMPMCLMHYFGNQVFSSENSHLFLKCHVHWISKERSPVAGQERAKRGKLGQLYLNNNYKKEKKISVNLKN